MDRDALADFLRGRREALMPADVGLPAGSEEFRLLWNRHEVGLRHEDHKTFVHPRVGRVTVDCEILATADEGKRLVILTAPPASESYGKLRLLAVAGHQEVGA
jgi:hypothetical protein